MHRIVSVVLCAVMLLASVPVFARGPQNLSGGTTLRIRGAGAAHLPVLSETVRMRVSKDGFVHTQADFEIANNGPKGVFEVGFRYGKKGDVRDLSVTVDGNAVVCRSRTETSQTETVGPAKYPKVEHYWQVWEISPPPKGRARVRASYRTALETFSGHFAFSDYSPWYKGEEKRSIEERAKQGVVRYAWFSKTDGQGHPKKSVLSLDLKEFTWPTLMKCTPPYRLEMLQDPVPNWEFRDSRSRPRLSVTFSMNGPLNTTEVLEELHRKHPKDVLIGDKLGYAYIAEGRVLQGLRVLEKYLLPVEQVGSLYAKRDSRAARQAAWKALRERIRAGMPPEEAEAAMRDADRASHASRAQAAHIWGIASRVVRGYARLKRRDDAKRCAKRALPILKKFLKELEANQRNWGAKPYQRKSLKEGILFCKELLATR